MTERLGTIVQEHIARVTIGAVALDGILRLPREPAQSCCSPTEAEVAGSARVIAMWRGYSIGLK